MTTTNQTLLTRSVFSPIDIINKETAEITPGYQAHHYYYQYPLLTTEKFTWEAAEYEDPLDRTLQDIIFDRNILAETNTWDLFLALCEISYIAALELKLLHLL
jgi:hypothetical protein